MRVEILEDKTSWGLQCKINDWLKKWCNQYEIIDIKYSGEGYSVPYGSANFSAMIIYKF